ncbi:hypothetical protein SUGI_0916630 [Cryptomeria japonica]|uniref:protein OXIDATIVE STRESS 3 n=1 Tax=Cryptomeria japonica TaxID=3369 RepID=UPI002414CA02|nr:protein OXIDATIVE STRESS 3 [Cryptomeria japonica]GLJ43968.1 hypothetical protein SUGI_0916630 [Cryptomeria japonica]
MEGRRWVFSVHSNWSRIFGGENSSGSFVDLFLWVFLMDENENQSNSFSSFDSNEGTDSGSSNSSSWSNLSEAHDGPLFDMAALAANLPCKRGLSSFYGGKSQSFSCLADVKCVEELAKPEDSYYRKKKLKSFQSCGSRLNISSCEPRISSASMISKRSQKTSKLLVSKTAMNFAMSCRPPLSPTKHV